MSEKFKNPVDQWVEGTVDWKKTDDKNERDALDLRSIASPATESVRSCDSGIENVGGLLFASTTAKILSNIKPNYEASRRPLLGSQQWPYSTLIPAPTKLRIKRRREISQALGFAIESITEKGSPTQTLTYSSLSEIQKRKIKLSTANVQGRKIKLEDLLDDDENLYNSLSHDEIKKLLNDQEISIFDCDLSDDEFYVERKFRKKQPGENDSAESEGEDSDNNSELDVSDSSSDDENSSETDSGNGERSSDRNGGNSNENSDKNEDDEDDDNNNKNPPNNDTDEDSDDDDSGVKSLEDLIEEAQIRRVVLLNDESGSGLTTLLKKVKKKLIAEASDQEFVLNVELKCGIKVPPVHSNIVSDILVSIFKNCKAIKTKLEENLIMKFFNTRNLTIMWDHLERIQTSEISSFLDLLFAIKQNSHNQQWISVTSKTDLVAAVEFKLSTTAYEFVPFNQNEIESIARTKSNNHRAVISVKYNSCKYLENRFMKNPRIITLVVEALSKNQRIDPKNMYEIFDFVTKELFDTKSKIVKHQALALKILGDSEGHNKIYFQAVLSDLNCGKNIELNPNCLKDPIITQFLFAKIFTQNLLTFDSSLHYKELKNILKLFFYVSQFVDDNFKLFKMFVNHFMLKHIPKSKRIVCTTIKQDFRSAFDSFRSKPFAIDFVSNFFKHDKKILKVLWQMNESICFLSKIKNKNNYKEILDVASKYLKEDAIKRKTESHEKCLKFKKKMKTINVKRHNKNYRGKSVTSFNLSPYCYSDIKSHESDLISVPSVECHRN